MLAARRGRAHDPAVGDAVRAVAPAVLADLDTGDAWAALLAAVDGDDRIPPDRLDTALTALADCADLKSPWTRGHSRRVAALAGTAAGIAGLPSGQADRLRRAGLVHDLGRVGVPNGVWDRPGPLGVAERQRMRIHPYLTESVLACCPALAGLGRLAGAHHERTDGSGYHRGTRDLDQAARILAAADVVAALGEPRPHRPARPAAAVADAVAEEVRSGRLDGAAVAAVLAAAGQPVRSRRAAWPAGLTDREVEVLRLIARGRTNREVASALRLSVKTVGRHVENVYAKAGVRTRAGAALFAAEHRLLEPVSG
jgi:HD-GYP domain-containing protein (c-di-GMP phosphodiesterase class II)